MFTRCSFLFQNAWKNIIHNKYNSIVLLIALTVGFLFPLLALNDVNDLLRDGYVAKYEDASLFTIIDYSMKYKTEEEMYGAIGRCREEGLLETAGFCAYQGEIIYVGEESYSGGISAISKEYLTLSTYELVSGELFTQEDYAGNGGNICMLECRSSLVQNGVTPGDEIEILGEVYVVKGIVRAPRIYGGVMVPYGMASEVFSSVNGQMQYQVITYGETQPNPARLSRKLFQFPDGVGGVISAQTGTEQEEMYYQSMREVNRYRILRAVIVIVFACMNVVLLFVGMTMRERYGMAVRAAMGAGRKMLWMELLVRNLLLMSGAFFIAVLLYPMVAFFVKGAGSLQNVTVLQTGIGGIIIIFFISSMLFLVGFKKREIALSLKQ